MDIPSPAVCLARIRGAFAEGKAHRTEAVAQLARLPEATVEAFLIRANGFVERGPGRWDYNPLLGEMGK